METAQRNFGSGNKATLSFKRSVIAIFPFVRSYVRPFEEGIERIRLEILKDTSILYDSVKIGMILPILDIKPRLKPSSSDVVGHGA